MYFKMIRYVLDTTLAKTCAARNMTLAEGQKRLKEHLLEMNKEWFSKVEPDINYQDPFCRLAYLYCHTACNANICEVALRGQPEITKLIRARAEAGNEFRVCAFGGGPGTELLALAKHLLKNMDPTFPTVELNFTVVDLVVEWSESWEVMATRLRETIKVKWPKIADRKLHVHKSFMPFDATKIEAFANFDTILTHDFYVMNYVVSEVIDSVDALGVVMGKMREAASPDALFLIVDRDQDKVRKRVDALIAAAKLQTVNTHACTGRMDRDEDESELDAYTTSIDRRPRTWWKTKETNKGIFWVLARKP